MTLFLEYDCYVFAALRPLSYVSPIVTACTIEVLVLPSTPLQLTKMTNTVLAIGGSGAQGSAIVRALAQTGHFFRQGPHTQQNLRRGQRALQPRESEGDSPDVATLRSAFKGVDACYMNTNGFALGKKAEIYWGVRTFEIAREAGVKHYV